MTNVRRKLTNHLLTIIFGGYCWKDESTLRYKLQWQITPTLFTQSQLLVSRSHSFRTSGHSAPSKSAAVRRQNLLRAAVQFSSGMLRFIFSDFILFLPQVQITNDLPHLWCWILWFYSFLVSLTPETSILCLWLIIYMLRNAIAGDWKALICFFVVWTYICLLQ